MSGKSGSDRNKLTITRALLIRFLYSDSLDWHADAGNHQSLFWVHKDFQDRAIKTWENLAEVSENQNSTNQANPSTLAVSVSLTYESVYTSSCLFNYSTTKTTNGSRGTIPSMNLPTRNMSDCWRLWTESRKPSGRSIRIISYSGSESRKQNDQLEHH